MRRQFSVFVVRWLLNTFGLWLAVMLLGTGYEETPEGMVSFLVAGFIFSIVNSLFRPMLIILSLPILLVTLGLFMVIVNGLMVYLSMKLSPGMDIAFWNAVGAGIIISFFNYLMTNVLDFQYFVHKKEN